MKQQIYIVGGAVRDQLLETIPADIDYVAVGYTAEHFIEKGFKQVGKDFPVFLSPTGNEYALARRERSTGNGYNDFTVDTSDVTIEEDLKRRDLTINSMALDADNKLIDPYHGQEDIARKILRHTSEAFAEDPLRVLRLARFRARLGEEWSIAPETKLLIDSMRPKLTSLQPDRVFAEVDKVMKLTDSYIFFETLDELQVLDIVFPNIYDLKSYREGSKWHKEPNVFEHTMRMLQLASLYTPVIKYMILYHDICKPKCRRLYGNGAGHDSAEMAEPLLDIKLPTKIKEYVLHHIEYHQRIFKVYEDMSARKIVKLIKAFKKDKLLLTYMIIVGKFDKDGSICLYQRPHTDFSSFKHAFDEVNSFSPLFWIQDYIAKNGERPSGEVIKQYVHNEQIKIVKSIIIKERNESNSRVTKK
jgi:tRNA nucleotidyltransferase (CCA-adding enzyme)